MTEKKIAAAVGTAAGSGSAGVATGCGTASAEGQAILKREIILPADPAAMLQALDLHRTTVSTIAFMRDGLPAPERAPPPANKPPRAAPAPAQADTWARAYKARLNGYIPTAREFRTTFQEAFPHTCISRDTATALARRHGLVRKRGRSPTK